VPPTGSLFEEPGSRPPRRREAARPRDYARNRPAAPARSAPERLRARVRAGEFDTRTARRNNPVFLSLPVRPTFGEGGAGRGAGSGGTIDGASRTRLDASIDLGSARIAAARLTTPVRRLLSDPFVTRRSILQSLSLLLADGSNFETTALVNGMVRWAHIISGITWIGLLYFFNFVNGPTQGKLDGPTKKAVNPELLPRALWWFRWGAMSTLFFGLTLFVLKYMMEPNLRNAIDNTISDRALWIMTGMTLGTIMWFNVWFVIWPAQKVIIRATKEGQKPPEKLPPRAKLFSRINTILSAPMLVCMVAANNTIPFKTMPIAVSFIISLLVIHLALRAANTAGSSI
jgi:hypothetical protein